VKRDDDEPASSITRVTTAALESTEKGIAIGARGETPIADPFDTPMMNAVVVRWHDLLRAALVWEPVAALPLLRRELLGLSVRGAAGAHRRALERLHRAGRRVLRVRARDAPAPTRPEPVSRRAPVRRALDAKTLDRGGNEAAMIERARSRDGERR